MNTRKWLAALGIVLGLGWATQARAADKDSLTVTILPNAAYGVLVSTTGVGLDMGTVAMSASTQTVKPSTITITSSYASTNLTLQGIMGGANPWSFSANTAVPANDTLATWAVFTDTSVALPPAQAGSYFVGTTPGGVSGSNVVDGSVRTVGGVIGTGLFTTATGATGAKTMSNMPPFNPGSNYSGMSHLWLFFKLPPTTTVLDTKLVTFLLSAGA